MPARPWLRLGWEDPYTALLLAIVRAGLGRYRAIEAHQIRPPRLPPDRGLPVAWLPAVGPGRVGVARGDEDGGARPAWTQSIIAALGHLTLMRDDPLAWEGDPAREMSAIFDPYLPEPRFRITDPNSGEGMARFVLQGLGAHRLERVPGGAKLDFESLASIPVRPGFQPYGGVAIVDTEGRFVRLEIDGRAFAPGDPGFAAAAFRFRSTVLVAVTLQDHLGVCHYGVSNALLVATRRHLSPDHPLRRWLKPFVFRTGAINANALATLIGDRAMVHRASALSPEGFSVLRRGLLGGARFSPLPAALGAAGMLPADLPPGLSRRACFSLDGLAYWERLARFVERSLASPALRACLAEGATAAWWDDLAAALPGGLPERTQESFRDLLAWAVFVVTALHGHVGHVAPYATFPEVASTRTRAGEVAADRRVVQQVATLASMTGLAVPTIAQDFSHLMPDAATRRAAVAFRADLFELQEEIDARNAARDCPFPAFSPRHMPCSVSR